MQESPQPVVVLGRDRMAVHTHGVELSLTLILNPTPTPTLCIWKDETGELAQLKASLKQVQTQVKLDTITNKP